MPCDISVIYKDQLYAGNYSPKIFEQTFTKEM